ncbi:MAG: FAD-dependent oxidoreductase [Oscillospiraceae bacterium]|nr:FAD-dependent oxidoreductase [Oscillospiraceae bacterium]
MSTKRKTVIIGGVAGGASCAARLRRLDGEREIVILERGPYISYANCGLPYHVGDVIHNRSALLLMTPERMWERFRIDVRVNNEVTAIDREKKSLTVRRTETGEVYEQPYDDLVIATGSSPLRPGIPGIDSERIRTLWSVPDADEIRGMVQSGDLDTVAVIGGGFIGLEMAENLHRAGLKVMIMEAQDQVMSTVDFEMAQLLHENIRQNGVEMYLGDGVDSFEDTQDSVLVKLKSGRFVRADMVILSIGVRPNSALAKEAGLRLNERGGIVVDEHMRTEDPSVYAVGDVIEVEDFVSGDRTMVPLAGPANKQGRILADVLAGRDSVYKGTQGSSIAKVFDLAVASTGANEKTLIRRGLERGKDYESFIILQNSHATYYPGATQMTIKMLFEPESGKIFGAQIVGREGVDKRIDTIGVAMRLGASVYDLKDLELAYAPPFSSAKDPVNMAGFVAENIRTGLVKIAAYDAPDTDPDAILLDVREEAEVMAYAVPGAVNIPLGQLRDRLSELDPEKRILVFCAIGVRAYTGARILSQNGFGKAEVYPGGVTFYKATHPKETEETVQETKKEVVITMEDSQDRIVLDCCGLQCPGPIMEVYKTISDMKDGQMLEVSASDPGFARDIEAWCRSTGNTLVRNEVKDGQYTAMIRRGTVIEETGISHVDGNGRNGKTIIVFDGDMDKVLASFVIANGALAMGRPVTMFFTFWGLNALRRSENVRVKKNLIEKMFGWMLPRGAGKLKLSKMNMGGMGTAMMKGIMKDKNIDSLETMMKKAMENGVKIIACSMSMDVMGIRPEELIDGVEIGGVGTYLGAAEDSDVNLFI